MVSLNQALLEGKVESVTKSKDEAQLLLRHSCGAESFTVMCRFRNERAWNTDGLKQGDDVRIIGFLRKDGHIYIDVEHIEIKIKGEK